MRIETSAIIGGKGNGHDSIDMISGFSLVDGRVV